MWTRQINTSKSYKTEQGRRKQSFKEDLLYLSIGILKLQLSKKKIAMESTH